MWVKTDPLMKGIATESNTGGILNRSIENKNAICFKDYFVRVQTALQEQAL